MEVFRDSHRRSIAKALSWRLLGMIFIMSVALIFTGKVLVAAKIGMIDFLFKIVLYYFHERIWDRLPYGRAKPPEYTI